jgi:hypothetical protein
LISHNASSLVESSGGGRINFLSPPLFIYQNIDLKLPSMDLYHSKFL